MKKLTIPAALALAGTALLTAAAPAAASTEGFAGVLERYETVRRALVEDDFDAVQAPAAELAETAGRLDRGLSAETAGVPADRLDDVRALLPEIESAAESLAAAGDLATARDAFYALTKPLVRWRQAAGDGPAVVYCSMTKRSWLQAEANPIGNPYYGREMARCGEVVSK